MTLTAFVDGIGLLGPGLSGWPEGRAVLGGTRAYMPRATELPPADGLPAAERRRASAVVRLALAVGREAIAASGREPASLPTVFSASAGDGRNYHAICEQLASGDPLISPTRFHNAVHNAPAGYWGIATGAMAPSNVMCAHDGSFGAGLLDSLGQVVVDDVPCVLISYDTEYEEPLRARRPVPDAFGVALVLAPQAGPQSLASISVELISADTADTVTSVTSLAEPALEALRALTPSARALPLLRALACRTATDTSTQVVIDYLDDLLLQVSVTPCPSP